MKSHRDRHCGALTLARLIARQQEIHLVGVSLSAINFWFTSRILTSFSSFSLSANLWLSLSAKSSATSRFSFKLSSSTRLPPPLTLAIWFNSQLSVLTSEFLEDTLELIPSSGHTLNRFKVVRRQKLLHHTLQRLVLVNISKNHCCSTIHLIDLFCLSILICVRSPPLRKGWKAAWKVGSAHPPLVLGWECLRRRESRKKDWNEQGTKIKSLILLWAVWPHLYFCNYFQHKCNQS